MPLALHAVNQAWGFRAGRMRAAQSPAYFGQGCREQMLQHPATNAQGETTASAVG